MVEYWYIAFGGGRDSTAMLFEWWKRDLPKYDIIFSDTGAEHDETIEHVKNMIPVMIEKGHNFIYIKNDIYGWFMEKKRVPDRRYRKDCTDKFKVVPTKCYIRFLLNVKTLRGIKVFPIIGINKDEEKRVNWNYANNVYPLVDWNIGDKQIEKILKDNLDYEVIKSRCFFCPYQSKDLWNKSMKKYSQDIIKLVKNANCFLNYPLRIREGDTLLEDHLSISRRI